MILLTFKGYGYITVYFTNGFYLMGSVFDTVRLPFHYGWVIAFTGMLSIFACLGFARFVLGMLLPSMSAGLHLSYSEMGLLGTGNFLGYLIAVLLAGKIVGVFNPKRTLTFGLTVSGVSMILIGLSNTHSIIGPLYLLTGMGSGLSNVAVMGLITRWFDSDRRGRASGFVVIGSGFALLISGVLIPWINSAFGTEGWRIGWIVSAVIVLIVTATDLILIRNSPQEMGLAPIGRLRETKGQQGPELQSGIYLRGIAIHLGLIYLLFGFSYVIYITFIVMALVKDYGFDEAVAGQFWAWIGLLSLLSGPIFGTLSDRIGRARGFMTVFVIQCIAYGFAASGIKGIPLYLSIVFFGITAWSIPSIMAAAAADYFGPIQAPTAFGYITFIFGIGQIAGPIVTGLVAEVTGGFSTGFLMAAIAAALAVVLSSLLKRPQVIGDI